MKTIEDKTRKDVNIKENKFVSELDEFSLQTQEIFNKTEENFINNPLFALDAYGALRKTENGNSLEDPEIKELIEANKILETEMNISKEKAHEKVKSIKVLKMLKKREKETKEQIKKFE